MDIREYAEYHAGEILRLYTQVGWTAYTEDMATLEQGYQHSLLVLAAYENGELLGIVRVVGDGATVLLVQDILVYPTARFRCPPNTSPRSFPALMWMCV